MANMMVRAEPYAHRMKLDEIGGGRVIRRFSMGGKPLNVGTQLTREQILSINPTNRTALVGNFIDVWPRADSVGLPPPRPATADRAERHVVSLGFGRFKVYEGTLLTDEPVSRSEAYALAGLPEPRSK